MAKAFSIASWNVEHFKGDPARTDRVIAFLEAQNPDIIGLYEVEGKEVFATLTRRFPGYSFQITEGPQTQEILVGFRAGMSVFMTQKIQFKSGTTHMRPGLLATVSVSGAQYIVLFLHLASHVEPRGFGLRDDMAIRAIKFRKTLDRATGGGANYIFLGDLNTMGMDYPYKQAISAETELRRWDFRASRYYGLRRLSKTFDLTFSNGSRSSIPDSNLDHVYASKHLRFAEFEPDGGTRGEVDVRGWVNKTTTSQRDRWIERYSDHSLLYLEVQKV
ncbi:MAG: endonuclease/exonuclease/phosphatase family protein [Candidatus Bipolaricaulota bacterium]|nr:MAG: endonuclease/exonuclease/phosphatase family protein [Candidatus Bipolaricaulota bacterium]